MTPQNQPQPPKKRSYTSTFIYLGIMLILLVILVNSVTGCSSGAPRGSTTQFEKDIGLISTPVSATDEYKFAFRDLMLSDTERIKDDKGAQIKDDKVITYPGTIDVIRVPYNKIEAIVQQGNNFYVLYRPKPDDKPKTDYLETFKNNPSKHATYYFRYFHGYDIIGIREAYNNWSKPVGENLLTQIGNGENEKLIRSTVTNITGNIEIDSSPEPSSWFSFGNIMTILSILLLAVLIFFVARSFTSRGGLGNMGRNRATHTMGGAVRFTDVAGIDEEKEELQEVVQFLKTPRKFLELGARIPKGVLLVGQPGTGKTLLAKAIAGEAGVHFFSISGSDFSEMLVGVGPSRMRDLFETAKLNAPAIIFIDEIDSIARMRGVGVSGVSDENEQTLNQLLVQMDGFTKSEGVIVLAATNRPDVLDQALLRPGRFDRQIIVQMPDVKGREQILKVHAKGKPLASDVDLKRVAQIISGFSGADIENLLNEAAIIAAKKDKKKINMPDITEGINKVLLGPQKRSRIITDDDKKITAYHEAGHAVVSHILQPDQVVQEVSIIPRGMAAGYTLTNEKDIESHHKSRKFLKTQLAVYMAGRVAEQIFIGDICTGSSNDLKVATGLAERMVTMFGMSDKLGPLFYGKEEEMALRLYNAQNPHSESLQALIDNEVKAFILDAEKATNDILKAQKAKVDTMAQVLLERETIYAADITLIMQGKTAKAVIAEMEKRDIQAREQEQKDKIESSLASLDRDLDHIWKHSQDFVDAKLCAPEKLEQLRTNMELARDVIRKGGKLTHLPTIDNLDEYANLIKADSPQSADEKLKPKAAKKPVKKTETKE